MAGEKINQIGLSDLGRLGLGDRTNTLYFDGQRVHTDAVVTLTSGQTRFAIVVGVATAIGAIATAVYSGVYVYDTLFRAKSTGPSIQSAVAPNRATPAAAAHLPH